MHFLLLQNWKMRNSLRSLFLHLLIVSQSHLTDMIKRMKHLLMVCDTAYLRMHQICQFSINSCNHILMIRMLVWEIRQTDKHYSWMVFLPLQEPLKELKSSLQWFQSIVKLSQIYTFFLLNSCFFVTKHLLQMHKFLKIDQWLKLSICSNKLFVNTTLSDSCLILLCYLMAYCIIYLINNERVYVIDIFLQTPCRIGS